MRKLFVFSGAGLSAESGLGTFRDADGHWKKHDLSRICNYSNWKQHKREVFEFYNDRRRQLETAMPNLAHYAIAELEEEFGPERVINVTMNVDDLLERAGCTNVLHVHGNLTTAMCDECNTVFDIGYSDMVVEHDICEHCGSIGEIKPGVVFFGEGAPNYQRMYSIFSTPTKDDIILVIGTSGAVINPDYLLEWSVPSRKILINKEPAGLSHLTYEYHEGSAAIMLPKLLPEIRDYLNK